MVGGGGADSGGKVRGGREKWTEGRKEGWKREGGGDSKKRGASWEDPPRASFSAV